MIPVQPPGRRGAGPRSATARTLVKRLGALKNRFTPADRETKRALLEHLRQVEILDPQVLLDYHETLLFIRAYPDDARLFRLACRECAEFGGRVARLCRQRPRAAAQLEDSGIAGTAVYYRYDYAVVTWLVHWFGDALEIDWDDFEATEQLDQLLPLFAAWVENDGLDLAEITTREWIELGRGRRSSLRWLLENLRRAIPSFTLRMTLYDGLDLPVVWQLGDSPVARTHAGAPARRPYFHGDGLLKPVGDLRPEIRKPLATIDHAPPRAAKALIHALRSTLAVRHRALYPIDHANRDEVVVADVGRGYEIILFGMLPERRLPLESDYGVLIVKNGFIFGYGVGALLFDQVEIAVNIFDTWRGGESRYLFTQFLRVFHHHFGCRRFKIERYQIGYENEEGIQSGAFWFYHRLGFVPRLERVRALAAREQARIAREPSHRTPAATLERMAESDLYLDLEGKEVGDDFPVAALGLAVTAMIGRDFDGDRDRALAGCAAAVGRALGAEARADWPALEQRSFERLSLIMALIPDLERWPAAEKEALGALMRVKGALREADYARQMVRQTKLPRLRPALELAARG